ERRPGRGRGHDSRAGSGGAMEVTELPARRRQHGSACEVEPDGTQRAGVRGWRQTAVRDVAGHFLMRVRWAAHPEGVAERSTGDGAGHLTSAMALKRPASSS